MQLKYTGFLLVFIISLKAAVFYKDSIKNTKSH